MKLRILSIGLFACTTSFLSYAQSTSDWKIAGSKIRTDWAAKVDPQNTLSEYPRPQLVRGNFQNLNGLWNYGIVSKATELEIPSKYDGKILVPFAVESALSGVGRTVGKDSLLWYQRTVSIKKMNKNRILLNFGAVDWACEVFVNGKSAGSHKGGYDPFSFDITSLLVKGEAQDIKVRVWDPSSDGPQPRGKQIKNPNSIWYTPVTGIWQTVWLESVPETYITGTKNTPDIDKNQVAIQNFVQDAQPEDVVKVSIWDGSNKVGEVDAKANETSTLNIASPKLWNPESPFLYDIKVAVIRKGKVVDEVKSYFAMRKISMKPDANGTQRMLLNNQFVFQYGPLDQGWWPDGLYTAPTDEALKFDIAKTKEMGFNMIRKHVKVEPARWYRYCDELGMLVWQDMPSGDMGNHWEPRPGITGLGTEKNRTPESEEIYRREWKAILDANYNFPSIVVWVAFNEAWGQFKTEEITKWTMAYDPSRLVNSASGGNFFPVGHIIDLHNYPAPAMPTPSIYGKGQVVVLGEFGGLGLPVDGHTWQQKDNWGYQSFKSQDELFNKYETFIKNLEPLIKQGLSAGVYTQTTDVEVEINGIMTYDRKVIKMPESKLKAIHSNLYKIQP